MMVAVVAVDDGVAVALDIVVAVVIVLYCTDFFFTYGKPDCVSGVLLARVRQVLHPEAEHLKQNNFFK